MPARPALCVLMTLGLVGCSPTSHSTTQLPSPANVTTATPTVRSSKATPHATSTVGLGRKDAAHARLPERADDFRTLGDVIEATMSSSALYVAGPDDSWQVLAVLVRRPWVDVHEVTKDLAPTVHDLAMCGAAMEGHYCYVQLRGGFLNLTAPATVPLVDLASLANGLYATFS